MNIYPSLEGVLKAYEQHVASASRPLPVVVYRPDSLKLSLGRPGSTKGNVLSFLVDPQKGNYKLTGKGREVVFDGFSLSFLAGATCEIKIEAVGEKKNVTPKQLQIRLSNLKVNHVKMLPLTYEVSRRRSLIGLSEEEVDKLASNFSASQGTFQIAALDSSKDLTLDIDIAFNRRTNELDTKMALSGGWFTSAPPRFLITHHPFAVMVIDAIFASEGTGEAIANWDWNDYKGSQWRTPWVKAFLRLPPQAIGEQMERGNWSWALPGTPDIKGHTPVSIRLSRSTLFTVSPLESATRRYLASFVNPINLLNETEVISGRFEMAYPIEIAYDSATVSKGRVVSREMGSGLLDPVTLLTDAELLTDANDRVGANFFRRLLSDMLANWFVSKLAINKNFKNSHLAEYTRLRANHLAQVASFYRRVAQANLGFEVESRDGIYVRAERWRDGLNFKLRTHSDEAGQGAPKIPLPTRSTDIATASPEIKDYFSDQNKQLRALGILSTFEFLPELEAVLKQPFSVDGSIEALKISALGATGAFEVSFDQGRTGFQIITENGLVSKIVKTRVGRIGAVWNKAKHTIVYERTVVPSAQFRVEQGELYVELGNPPEPKISADSVRAAKWGWPILRKTQEYIDIVQPERIFSQESIGASNRNRGLHAFLAKRKRIFVNGAWGRSLKDGYELPLFNPLDISGFYSWPHLCLVTSAGEGADENPGDRSTLSEHAIEHPEHVYFYTSTSVQTDGDSDTWDAVCDVDYDTKLRLAPFAQTIGVAPDVNVIMAPQVHGKNLASPRFQIKVNSGGPMNVNHNVGNPENQLLVNPRLISISRSSAQLIPKSFVDNNPLPTSAGSKTLTEQLEDGHTALLTAAKIRSVVALTAVLPKEIEKIAARFLENIGTEDATTFCNRAKAELIARIDTIHAEGIGRLTFAQPTVQLDWLATSLVTQPFKQMRNEIDLFFKDFDADSRSVLSVIENSFTQLSSYLKRLPPTPIPEQEYVEIRLGIVDQLTELLSHPLVIRIYAHRERVASLIPAFPKLDLTPILTGAGSITEALEKAKTVIAALDPSPTDGQILSAQKEITDLLKQAINDVVSCRTEINRTQNLPSWTQRIKDGALGALSALDAGLQKAHKQVSDFDQNNIQDYVKTLKGTVLGELDFTLSRIAELNTLNGSLGAISGALPAKLAEWISKPFDELLKKILFAAGLSVEKFVPSTSDLLRSKVLAVAFDKRDELNSLTAEIIKTIDDTKQLVKKELESLSIQYTVELNKIEIALSTAVSTATTSIAQIFTTAAKHATTQLRSQFDEVCHETKKSVNALVCEQLTAGLIGLQNTVTETAKQAVDAVSSAVEEQLAKHFDEGFKKKLDDVTTQVQQAGKEWDQFKAKGSAAITLSEIFSNPPTLPHIDFNTVDFNCVFSDVEAQILTSPCVARIRQAEAALSELGLDVPVQNFLNNFRDKLPEGEAFGKCVKSLGGCNFEDLLKKFRLPDLPEGTIKVTQGFESKTRQAWLQTKIDHEFSSREELFGVGPLSFSVNKPHLQVDSRLESGRASERSDSKVAFNADWILQFGGQDLVTFKDVSLKSENGSGIKFNLDPQNVKPHPSLAFVEDILTKLGEKIPPALERVHDTRGNLVGVRYSALQNFPGKTYGIVSISDFAISSGFGVIVENGQMNLSASFGIGSVKQPVFISVGQYAGGGWLNCSASYRGGAIDYYASIGIAFGSAKAFDLASIARGKYNVRAFIEAGFSSSSTYFAAGIAMNGSAKVIGYLNANVDLLLQIAGDGSKVEGKGQLDVEIEVSWFYTAKFHRAVKQTL